MQFHLPSAGERKESCRLGAREQAGRTVPVGVGCVGTVHGIDRAGQIVDDLGPWSCGALLDLAVATRPSLAVLGVAGEQGDVAARVAGEMGEHVPDGPASEL